MSKHTYPHRYYTADKLKPLLQREEKQGERLVKRYLKWNEVFITLAQSERYDYDRLRGLRNALYRIHNKVIDYFGEGYPLYGWKEVELPASKERWELEEQGKLSTIRNQRWRELLKDNKKCEDVLIQQGENPANFCGICHHLFTLEEIAEGECACCQTHFCNDLYEEDY